MVIFTAMKICSILHRHVIVMVVWALLYLVVPLIDSVISSPEPLGSQGELIVYPTSRRPSVGVRPSASSFTMLKDLLLRNRWADQSQILRGASLGRGNDILFAASGSHDQDGRHAHIW